jgi:hypothetical protein
MQGAEIVVCEQKVFEALAQFHPTKIEMSLEFAIPLALNALHGAPQDAALVDANYVRREQDIYPKVRV